MAFLRTELLQVKWNNTISTLREALAGADKTKTLPGLAKVAVATALTTQASATKPTGTPSTADINNAINDVSECSIFVVQLSYKEIQGAARRLITQPFNVAERIFSYKKKQYLGVG